MMIWFVWLIMQRGENVGSTASMAKLTARERRFVQFASTEYAGQLYMTPQDFLESVIEAEPRRNIPLFLKFIQVISYVIVIIMFI